jgi:hypothetical protein
VNRGRAELELVPIVLAFGRLELMFVRSALEFGASELIPASWSKNLFG